MWQCLSLVIEISRMA
uniref:Uncharacterized protein n=1 Tax=Anguilla anguilla TaxID=7936 RepID=A0A0E9TWA4_ANGAN